MNELRPVLSAAAGRLAAARIVHGLPAELPPPVGRRLAPRGERSAITAADVKIVIHVAVEPPGTAIPGAGSNEHAAVEPFGSVVTIGSAAIRRDLVVTVGAQGCGAKADGDPTRAAGSAEDYDPGCENGQPMKCLHIAFRFSIAGNRARK